MKTRRWAESSLRADLTRLQKEHDAMMAIVVAHDRAFQAAMGSVKAQFALIDGPKF